MKITLVQQNIIWGKPAANLEHLDGLLSGIMRGGTDLIVLPEMFSTGFVTKNPELSEHTSSRNGLCASAIWMQHKAAQLDCAICGSIAVRTDDDSTCFNRFHFVKPNGEVTTYDKRHLFAYGGEDKTFTRGNERVTVEWRGVRMLLAVCYDLRFPVWLRSRGDYDGILLVANWPDKRRLAWDMLKCARAIENQCFVAAVNRCGTDPVCNYDGGTAFINPYGEELFAASDGLEQVINLEYDMNARLEYIKKFPVLSDADDFELKSERKNK